MLKSIRLQNFLSFGSEGEEVPPGALNVLIGLNGSRKSNLVEGISQLQYAPRCWMRQSARAALILCGVLPASRDE